MPYTGEFAERLGRVPGYPRTREQHLIGGHVMSRWIVFDSSSAAALSAAAQVNPELHDAGDALGAALSAKRGAIVLLPSATSGSAMLVTIRHMPDAVVTQMADVVVTKERYEASGFLGLRDEPVYEEEPAAPKKWWQRLLD